MNIQSKKNIFNVIWAAFEKIIQVILTMIMTGLIARYFGVELFGSYQFAMSIVFVATSITWLCPAEIFYSKVDAEGRLSKVVISTSIIYRLLISLFVYGGLILYTLMFKSGSEQQAFILILSVIILYSEPLGIFRFLLECQGYYYVMSIIRMIALVIKLAFISIFIFYEVSPLLILVPIIAEGAIVSGTALFVYKVIDKDYVFSVKFFDRLQAASFFKQGLRYWIGLVCMNIFLKFDRLFMESNLSKDEFGYYSAALSAFEQFSSIATMLVAVMAPILIYRVDQHVLKRNTFLMALLFLFMGLAGSGVLYFISEFIITLLYGRSFSDSVVIFKLSLLAIPLVFVDAALSTYMIKQSASIYFSIKWVSILILTVSLNTILYPEFGWKSGIISFICCWVLAILFSLSFYAFDNRHSTSLMGHN